MRKILKWIGLISSGLMVTAAITIGVLILLANARLNKVYVVPVEFVVISADSAPTVCSTCHEQELAPSPATTDEAVPAYSDGVDGDIFQDMDCAQESRNGVENDQPSLLNVMLPEFYWFSDADLSNVFGFVLSSPAGIPRIQARGGVWSVFRWLALS